MEYEPLVYAAGLWDAEGYAGIGYPKKRSRGLPSLSIHMTDKEPIVELAKLFNCTVSGKRSSGGNKPQYGFKLTDQKALYATKLIYPWSLVKKEGFEKILQHYKEEQEHFSWDQLDMNAKLNWAAGLWDGDGHISIQNEKRTTRAYSYDHPLASINLISLPAIERVQKLFGGNIYLKPRHKEQHSQAYVLKYSHKKAREILEVLTPYLRLKKDIAERVKNWERT